MTETASPQRKRKAIPLDRQVRVLFRDKWLCHLCGYPTVFPLALKYLERLVMSREAVAGPFAYYHFRYRHDAAPMLDYLACVIDHRESHARGGSGEEENLVTACNKCNMRKSDRAYVEHIKKFPRKKVNARFGPPERWDGLSSVFVTLAKDSDEELTLQERGWFKALTAFFKARRTAAQPAVVDERGPRLRSDPRR